ncbi:helix-turn-helix transcriptional regulator [Clostridioides sp. ES-S-0006-03]|uniref:helix-turn-helix domain-containing protein n=1 Tax=Clostridioides sp. ES-S-0006-03 TaxID=2770775 RepID=UPI001D0C2D23|nr:helix-turn-helix transcriptional regulator [Clostridioides sp. ES-S-0006-03]
MSIGKRLKDARKENGISQEDLAKQIGYSRGVITNIESDKTEPAPLVLKAICDILNLNEEWLLHGTGQQSNEKELSQSSKILSEIYTLSKDLSEEEQLYILDLINTFKNHKENIKKTMK